MSGYLIDTCAISEFQRPRPDLGLLEWFAGVDLSVLFLSVLTIGELRFGIERLRDRRKRARLERWLTSEVLVEFDGRILDLDVDAADRWGRMRATASSAGRAVPIIDALLTATAMRHNLAIVTRNEVDFRHAKIDIVNPWTGS